jgi:hypothetical protein
MPPFTTLPLTRTPSTLGSPLLCLGLIDEFFHDVMQIGILPCKEEHVVCSHG